MPKGNRNLTRADKKNIYQRNDESVFCFWTPCYPSPGKKR